MTQRSARLRTGTTSFALLALLCVAGCRPTPQPDQPASSSPAADPAEVVVPAELRSSLRFGQPRMIERSGTLQVAARVQTDARRVAHVGSPVKGRILKLLAFEGQRVAAGAVLATLHSTDLSDTQFALVKAVTRQSLAQAAEKRARLLLAADVIGEAELERRHAELLEATAEADSYHTQLLGLGMSESQIQRLETTRRLNADYPILAPRAGTLLKREITIGQVVQPADPAFTLADLSCVWVVANVPEQEAAQLAEGMQVEVQVPALPGETIAGRLSYISPTVDPATRTVEVHMDVPNPRARLKPDELASMTFTGQRQRVLTIPAAAVVREDNRDYVFVETAPGRCRLRAVTLGPEQGDRRPVLAGLQPSETLVTDGAFHLNNKRRQDALGGAQ